MQLKCISEAHNCIILYCLRPRIPESIGDILTSCWLFWEASWKAGIKTPPGGLSGTDKRLPTSLLHPTFDLRNPHGWFFASPLFPLEEITSDRLSPQCHGLAFYLKLDSGSPYLKPEENSGSSLIFKGSRAHIGRLKQDIIS